jgi:membrane-bound lytic murein transglycosylase B
MTRSTWVRTPTVATVLATVLAAVLATVLAACGGTTGEEAAPSPTTAEPPAQTSEPTAAPTAETAPEPEPEPSPEPPAPASDPDTLAAQLLDAETALRSDDLSDRDAAVAGMQQQVAYRTLAANPDWRAQVVAAVPPELRPGVEAQADAAAGLFRLAKPQPALPAWRIVEPPPPAELLGHYRAAEQEFGIGWEYLASIHLVETRMGRIRGTSSAGAQGPMQFMPGTWAQYGEGDVEDPRDAIRAAARYLRASGGPGNMDRALFAYNRSDHYVHAIATYAEQMRADERLYRGYYHWQVYYRHVDGDRVLPVGYDGTAPSG